MWYKVLFIFLVIVTVGLGGYYFFHAKKTGIGNAPYNPQYPVNSSPTITLPIDPSAQGVYAASVVYTFSGKISEIKKQGGNLILTLNLKTQGLPVFITSPSTSVIIQNKGKSTQATLADLKVGQNVILPTTYYLKEKTWQLQTIIIQK